MVQKAVLLTVFIMSAGLFYLVSPSWGCAVEAQCVITCYDSSGQKIGDPVPCFDQISGTGECNCDTTWNVSGQAACYVQCSGSPQIARYCTF